MQGRDEVRYGGTRMYEGIKGAREITRERGTDGWRLEGGTLPRREECRYGRMDVGMRGGKQGTQKEGREGVREGGREVWREGGREGGRERGMDGGRGKALEAKMCIC